MSKLTHIDAEGRARMVDVSDKAVTARQALAKGFIRMAPETLELAVAGTGKKGDVRAVAEIAGVMAAKRTPDLIPLCHPIGISSVTVDLDVDTDEGRVRIAATVGTTDRTGVEMEALTAAAVAGLTVHDMIKGIDPASVMTDVRVERKEGGKTGLWVRDAD